MIIRTAILGLLLILAYSLAILGINYIEIGEGLMPEIAFTLSIVIFIVVVRTIINDILDEVTKHRMAQVQREQQDYRISVRQQLDEDRARMMQRFNSNQLK